MLFEMLFGDEFIITVERLDIHLFVWKQKGRCVDLLEKSHNIFFSLVTSAFYNQTKETSSLV